MQSKSFAAETPSRTARQILTVLRSVKTKEILQTNYVDTCGYI